MSNQRENAHENRSGVDILRDVLFWICRRLELLQFSDGGASSHDAYGSCGFGDSGGGNCGGGGD